MFIRRIAVLFMMGCVNVLAQTQVSMASADQVGPVSSRPDSSPDVEEVLKKQRHLREQLANAKLELQAAKDTLSRHDEFIRSWFKQGSGSDPDSIEVASAVIRHMVTEAPQPPSYSEYCRPDFSGPVDPANQGLPWEKFCEMTISVPGLEDTQPIAYQASQDWRIVALDEGNFNLNGLCMSALFVKPEHHEFLQTSQAALCAQVVGDYRSILRRIKVLADEETNLSAALDVLALELEQLESSAEPTQRRW